jgi:glycosyltransferase involved in cell wall biosynthesis
MKVMLLSQIAVVDYKYTYSLANSLKAAGNEVELVIDDKLDNDYCQCKCYNKFLTSRKDIGKLKKLINYCKAYRFIVKKAIEEEFEVVHVQWFQFSPVDYFYLKKLKSHGIKVVVSVHDILPFNEKRYDMAFHKKIYALCDHIIVQAKTNIERFGDLFPEDTDKVVYIPHGHFLDFADIHNSKDAKEHLGIPSNKLVLLFFGQIKKVKGVGVLLEAFGKLAQSRDDMYLVVAGSVWKDDFRPYQEIIDKYELRNDKLKTDIRFIPDDEVGYYYSACDIAMMPYLDVYQSGVIQLVYAYEKPAIATAIPPFMEIVEDNVSGFICEPGNVESLMLAIERAALSINRFHEMGIHGKNIISEKYSWKKIASQITELYRGKIE